MKRDIFLRENEEIIEIQVVYIICRFRSLGVFSGPSSLCQTVLFVAVAIPISKTFHLFLTVPLIIPQRASVLLSFFYKARNFLDTIVRRNFSLRSDIRKFLLK